MKQIQFSALANLQTPRLILRRLDIKDVAEIFKLRNDAVVNKYLDRAKKTSMPEVLEFIEQINKGIEINKWLYWVITLKDSDSFAGTICLWNIDEEKNIAEIGYELLPEHHGKGIMHEALMRLIHFGFEELKLKALQACTHKENERSMRLLERNNFTKQPATETTTSNEVFYYLHKRDKPLYSSFT